MGSAQISVNDTLSIPENKPDIQSIVRISSTSVIDKTITLKKKIYFCGHVDMCIEYVANASDSTKQIHFLRTDIFFTGLLFHPLARKRFNAYLKTFIRFCNAEVTSPRTISTIILLKICKVKFSRIPHTHKYQCKPKHPFLPENTPCHCTTSQNSLCPPTPAPCECKKSYYKDCTPYDAYPYPHLHPSEFKLLDMHPCKQPPYSDASKPCHPQPKPPHHNEDCKPPLCWVSKPPQDNGECKIQDCHQQAPSFPQETPPAPCTKHDEPPYHHCDFKTYHGYEDKQPPGKYSYTSYHSGYSKIEGRDPVPSDGYHTPTSIQPYTRMGNSHGVSFGYFHEN